MPITSAATADYASPADTTSGSYCCDIERLINESGAKIVITNAQKVNEGGGSFIAYNISIGNLMTKRRYSEFESLRNSLCKLYPTALVPPIPEKHSFTDYATMQNRVKDDVVMIEKRKRMLQTFLNRLAEHPILSTAHAFHRFLDVVPWSEVLHQPPLNNLPKNPHMVSPTKAKSSGNNTDSASSSGLLPNLPNPSPTQKLRQPDMRFADSEAFTNKFIECMSLNVDKSQRRVVKRLGELANDYSELGAIYNGFSLNETGALANAIEKVGQAIDSSYVSTGEMIATLESEFAEPIQEYTQYGQHIKQVLKYRHLKHLQVEVTEDNLESKRAMLETLEKTENEAKRIEEALKRDRQEQMASSFGSIKAGATGAGDDEGQEQSSEHGQRKNSMERQEEMQGNRTQEASSTVPATATTTDEERSTGFGEPSKVRGRKRSSGTNFLSVISHKIHGIMDVDPELTRRNNIGKMKDAISQLEETLEVSSNDLVQISAAIQHDLDRFQQQKIADLREMLLAYARSHVKWCEKNLNAWEEAQAEIEKINV
ncbi:uncharacterized protein VTP21DRAFT_6243 [Calcarisporiella thermophila]|uniref:uncharacterized protein n=1 Tax=Calcarisporiella thermophila TaxID=911321 RepID=UPI00374396CE